jgi:hypothetical protein
MTPFIMFLMLDHVFIFQVIRLDSKNYDLTKKFKINDQNCAIKNRG